MKSAGAGVTHYRLYLLNKLGRIVGREEAEVATDAEAADIARGLDHTFAIEVWDRARQVGIIHPRSDPEPVMSRI